MRVSLSPPLTELAPGDEAEFLISVENDSEDPLSPSVEVNGVDAGLVSLVDDIVVLAPGSSTHTVVRVRVPADTPAGEQRFGVTVSDREGFQAAAGASAAIRVGARPAVSVEINPPLVEGRRSGKFDAILRNNSPEPQLVHLDGGGEGVELRFRATDVELEGGEAVRVPTRIRRLHRSWFKPVRHGALVHVRGTGAPVSAPATFTQKPVVPSWSTKLVAVIALLALWASVVVVVNNRMNAEPEDAAAAGQGTGAQDGAAGEDAAGGDGASGGEEGHGEAEAPAPPVVVQGAVEGPRDLTGTEVVIERLTFGDEGTTSDGGNTKLAAMAPVSTPVGKVLERIDTTTDERGRFRFASGLALPAFYRVTALRSGFEIGSMIVQTSEATPEVEVAMALVPAPGAMSGRAVADDGTPLGGAAITLTNGDLVYRTTAATEGDAAGTWSIEGLASPATYQVAIAKRGYATATLLVDLEGGQQLGGVDAELPGNLGTVYGRITHRDEGVGAVTIELLGDGVQRTTTTFTEGALKGGFSFPALPYGVYQLTFSAPGWLTQTSEVVVDRGDVELLVKDLRPSTAIIQGAVEQEVAPGGCTYPSPDDQAARDGAVATPCGGIGVSVVGPNGTFRTTTATGTGFFKLSGVPAGEYTMSFERFGYIPQFLDVAVEAGDVLSLPEDLEPASRRFRAFAGLRIKMELVPPVDEAVGEAQAVIRSAADPDAVFTLPANTAMSVVGQAGAKIEKLAEGAIKISGLTPGAHTVKVDAPGYDVRQFVVRVGMNAVADAGTVILTPLATLALRVTDGGESPIKDAEVFVTAAEGEAGTGARLSSVTDEKVRTCTAQKDAAGRWRVDGGGSTGEILQGICATVPSNGELTFTQALGTGSYRIMAPVNGTDPSQNKSTTAERAVRAGTVPLDHEQLIRDVEVASGETSRIDLRARRYGIVEGTIREPSGDNYRNASQDEFVHNGVDGLSFFPNTTTYTDNDGYTQSLGISLVLTEAGKTATPAEGLRPRLSYGPADGLPEGVYRINRILPNQVEITRDYKLGFYSEGRQFEYEGKDSIAGLAFGETRIASAVLAPQPVIVDFHTFRKLANGTEIDVAGVGLTVTGITEYAIEGGSGLYAIDETVNVTTGTDGKVRAADADGEIVKFLSGLDLDITATKNDYDTLVTNKKPQLGQEMKVQVTPKPRQVRGSIQLVPVVGSTSAALNALAVSLEAVGANPAVSITTNLTKTIVDGAGCTACVLQFTFASVPPDNYQVKVTGTGVIDYLSSSISIEPGPQATLVNIGPNGVADSPPVFPVDLGVDLDVDITEVFPAVGGTTQTVAGATVQLKLGGTVVATADTGDGTGGTTAGRASFNDVAGGTGRDYLVVVTEPGYKTLTSMTFQLNGLTNDQDKVLVRYGSITGNLDSFVSSDDATPDLQGATVTLVNASDVPVDGVAAKTSAADGSFSFPNTDEIPAGTYQLRITHADHDTKLVSVTVVDATVTALGTIQVDKKRATISGTVRNLTSTGTALPHVRVTARNFDDPTKVYGTTVTDANGAYSLTGLPPRKLTLRFEEFTDATTTVATSRRIHEIDRTPTPGQSLTGVDIALLEEHVAISGTVTGRDFADADAPSRVLQGATVTATCTTGATCGIGTSLQTTTAADGTYAFRVLDAGTWTLSFSAAGYDGVTNVGSYVVVRFALATDAFDHDQIVTATPTDVVVTASSSDSGTGALQSATVTATYVKPTGSSPVPTTTHNGSFVFTGATDANGKATLTLPPGEWTVATSGADAASFTPRPHKNVTTTLEFDANPSPVPTVSLALPRYVKVSGVVEGRDFVGATAADLSGAKAVPAQVTGQPDAHPVSSAVATATGVDGAWTVYLPPKTDAGTQTWTIDVTQGAYEGARLSLDLTSSSTDIAVVTGAGPTIADLGSLAAALTADGVVLTASPVSIPVAVVSDVGGGGLESITTQATWTGGATAPPSNAAYRLSQASDASGNATLLLAPGSWSLATTDAQTNAHLGDGQRPHRNLTGHAVAPTAGATVATQTLTLDRYVLLSGVAQGQDFVGDTEANLASVTVTPTRSGETAPAFGATTTSTGAWSLYVPPTDTASTWTVTLGHDDYDQGKLTVDVSTSDAAVSGNGFTAVAQTDLFTAEISGDNVVLTATPVPVVVTVQSAETDSNNATILLDGVTVTASHPGAPAPSGTRYDLTGVTGEAAGTTDDGKVTLMLAPAAAGAWEIATTGAENLSPVHANQSGVDLVAVPVGGSPTQTLTLAQDLGLRITVNETYPAAAAVSGVTVALFEGSGGSRTAVLSGGNPVTGTTDGNGQVTFSGLNNKKTYSVDVTKTGWVDVTDAASGKLSAGITDKSVTIERYGSVTGSAVTLIDGDIGATAENVLLGSAINGATVQIIQDVTADPDVVLATTTTDASGNFAIANTAEVAAGTYDVVISATNHQTRTITDGVTVANDTTAALGTIRVSANRATVSGTITAPDLQHVKITVIRIDDLGADDPLAGTAVVTTTMVGPGVNGSFDYSVPNLPPRDLKLRFEEFADAGGTIVTSRATLEVTVSNLTYGETRTAVNAAMVTFAALQGTVTSEAYSGATAANLDGATITATCTATVADGCTLNETFTATSAANGTYFIQWLDKGNYNLSFEKSGYTTGTHSSIEVVRFATSGAALTVDKKLTATAREVSVTLVSSVGGSTLGAGVVVTATGPGTGGAPGPFAATTNSSGVATFSDLGGGDDRRLAPVEWTFTTSGATGLMPPHKELTGTATARTVPVGTTALSFGTAVDDAGEALTLTRYASVEGTVNTRPYAGATEAATGTATVAVTTPASGGVAETPSNADSTAGKWRVWVPDPQDVTVTLSQSGYANNTASVLTAAFTDRAATVGAAVVLTATPREVSVTLVSSVGGSTLGAGVVVTATGPGTGGAPGPFTATTNSSGVATFSDLGGGDDRRLAPVEWTFTTSGATGLMPPHKELTGTATARTVPVGTTALSFGTAVDDAGEALTLTRYASVEGTVQTKAYAGDGSPAATATATVAVSGTGVAETPSNADSTAGKWRVWVPDPPVNAETFTVTLSQTGYDDGTATVNSSTTFTSRAATISTPVDLIATPRDVAVSVVSSVDATPLQGVSVTATSSVGLGPFTATTNASGVATFTTAVGGDGNGKLAPVSWTFTTTNATTLLPTHPPHKNETVGEIRSVTVGTGTLAFDQSADGDARERLTLTRYASVTGTVQTKAYASDGSPAATATATVAVSGTGVAETPSNADSTAGKWRVWVPDPPVNAETFTVTLSQTGYANGTVTVDANTTFTSRAATIGTAVDLVAVPRTVAVSVVSSVDATALQGVSVTATSTVGLGPFTVTTNSSGVATFDDTSGTGGSDKRLAPVSWTFSTTNATTLLPTHPPHKDEAGAARTVTAGTGTLSFNESTADNGLQRLTLTRYASVTGTVQTKAYASDGSPAATATATVAVSGTGVAETPSNADSTAGKWRVWVPDPPTGGDSFTVTLSQTGYDNGTVTVDANTTFTSRAATIGTAVDLVGVPREVTFTVVSSDGGGALHPVTVTLTGPAGAPGPFSEGTVDSTGVVTFTGVEALAPTTWTVTTSGATALATPHHDITAENNVTIVVPAGSGTYTAPNLVLTKNSRLFGRVGEMRNGSFTYLAGIEIQAERSDDLYSTTSTEEQSNGDNYMLRAESGTWRITAVRNGVSYLVDDAFVIQKSNDREDNWLEVVLPTLNVAEVAGRVTNEAGLPVAGANVTAVSTAGTVVVSSGADGTYTLGDLDPDVTWAVTFTPPEGVFGQPVTRYVAPGGRTDVVIGLDQTIPSNLGNLQVDLTGGAEGADVTMTLTETGPFPTLNAAGSIAQTTTVGADGTASILFGDLVPGDGNSVPQNRFTVTVEVTGFETVTRTGIEVMPAQTTAVAIELTAVVVKRTVELALTSGGEPLNDRSVSLVQDGTVLPSTVAPGTNVYSFSGVAAGDWTVTVTGYVDATLTVPSGEGTYATSLDLLAVEASPSPSPNPNAPPAPSPSPEASPSPSPSPEASPSPDASPSPEPSPSTTESGTA